MCQLCQDMWHVTLDTQARACSTCLSLCDSPWKTEAPTQGHLEGHRERLLFGREAELGVFQTFVLQPGSHALNLLT